MITQHGFILNNTKICLSLTGCQLYAVTGNQSFRLSMVVNVGRKINLFKWNLSQITQLQSSTDIARHFEFIKVNIQIL